MNDLRDDIRTLRQLVKAENEFINHRLTWLGAFQGLLLAALAFAWDKGDTRWLVVVICVVGMAWPCPPVRRPEGRTYPLIKLKIGGMRTSQQTT